MTPRIAIVIPTRNRPRFAINAVRALIDQDAAIDLFVSDNSDEGAPLEAFCADLAGVTYLRPPGLLSMGDNWEWGVGEALTRSAATHIAVHYDRRLAKPHGWDRLAAIAARQPNRLITYTVDQVAHWPPPRRIWQAPWTGGTYLLRTANVARSISRARVTEVGHAFPLLSNCVVPRTLIEAMLTRFGSVCQSVGTDSTFLARFLTIADDYIFSDRAAGINYGTERSNGLGYLRGRGGDYADFERLSRDTAWLKAGTIAGLSLGNNMLYHEYELIRRATGDRLPPVDRGAALADLGRSLSLVADSRVRRRYAALLAQQGWTGDIPVPLGKRTRTEAKAESMIRRKWAEGGVAPATISGLSFQDDETALRWALRYPALRTDSIAHIAELEPARPD